MISQQPEWDGRIALAIVPEASLRPDALFDPSGNFVCE